jgi:hypothetical protein
MATNFRNAIEANVGTTERTLITAGPASKNTIIGFSVTNLTEGVVVFSVKMSDGGETPSVGYFVRNVPIPPNQSLRIINGGEKLILAPNNIISIVADQNNALDVIASYVEIT